MELSFLRYGRCIWALVQAGESPMPFGRELFVSWRTRICNTALSSRHQCLSAGSYSFPPINAQKVDAKYSHQCLSAELFVSHRGANGSRVWKTGHQCLSAGSYSFPSVSRAVIESLCLSPMPFGRELFVSEGMENRLIEHKGASPMPFGRELFVSKKAA